MANPLFSLVKRKSQRRPEMLGEEYLPTFAFGRNGAVIRPEFMALASVGLHLSSIGENSVLFAFYISLILSI